MPLLLATLALVGAVLSGLWAAPPAVTDEPPPEEVPAHPAPKVRAIVQAGKNLPP